MKERTISALVALVILLVIVLLHSTPVLNISLAIIAIIASYELLNATKLIKYRILGVIPILLSVILPFALNERVNPYLPAIILVLAVVFFLTVISKHGQIRFADMAMSLMFAIAIPLFFSTAVYLRDDYGSKIGLYYMMVALGSAWFCDTCAFFAGSLFGKHKMAPTISPKKTIEGGIGGVIGAVVLNLIMSYIIVAIYAKSGFTMQVNYLVLGIVSVPLALLGMMGDLVASAIKREYKIKDYGHIMPGHGGIMDRFDSVAFTLPAVYIITKMVTIAS